MLQIQNCWTTPWSPCPWSDPELERLRRMKQQREIEEEKQRLRDWLWRHGMPVEPAPIPCPMPFCPPLPSAPRPHPGIQDVLRRIR